MVCIIFPITPFGGLLAIFMGSAWARDQHRWPTPTCRGGRTHLLWTNSTVFSYLPAKSHKTQLTSLRYPVSLNERNLQLLPDHLNSCSSSWVPLIFPSISKTSKNKSLRIFGFLTILFSPCTALPSRVYPNLGKSKKEAVMIDANQINKQQ